MLSFKKTVSYGICLAGGVLMAVASFFFTKAAVVCILHRLLLPWEQNPYFMKMHLSVEGRILASVPIDPSKAGSEYYLKAFRRMLIIRHYEKLAKMQKHPTFLLDGGSAKRQWPSQPITP